MKKIISFITVLFLFITSCFPAFAQGAIKPSVDGHNVHIKVSDLENNVPAVLTISSDKGRVFIDQHSTDSYGNTSFQIYLQELGKYHLQVNDIKYDTPLFIKNADTTGGNQFKESYWPSFRKNNNNLALFDADLTKKDTQFIENWKTKISSSYSAISTPLIIENKVYVVSGQTLFVFDTDGNKINTTKLQGSTSYYASFLAFGEGLLFAHIGDGKIQAIDAKTLESKWVSTIGENYNTLSPIAYKDGYIFTGSGRNANDKGSYVGIKVQDLDPNSGTEENKPIWEHVSNKSYYWSGGAIVGDTIIFVGDDGTLISAKTKNGVIIDTLELGGAVRTSIVYDPDTKNLIIGAVDSRVHVVKLKTDGSFDDGTYKRASLPSQCTSPGLVYNNRLYIGSGKFDTGYLSVFKLDDLTEIYTAKVGLGGIQGGLLATSTYASDQNNQQINIYFTRNNNPGGLYMIKDFEGNTTAQEIVDVYMPKKVDQNYCAASPVADKNGNIYYSNDSGHLFALKHADLVNTNYDVQTAIKENTAFVLPSGEAITFGHIEGNDALVSIKNVDKPIISANTGVKQSGSVLAIDIGNTTLLDPAKIKLPITNTSLADKSSIYYYNLAKGLWEYVPSTREGDFLVAPVDHFSTYGVFADTTGPKNVHITGTDIGEKEITLHFSAYDESPIEKYYVYKDDFENLYTSVTSDTFTDTNLTTGQEYKYKIVAEDHFGNKSSISELASFTPVKNTSSGSDKKPDGIPVYVRVVGYDGEIVPRKLIYVKNFDLTSYLSKAKGSSAKPSTGWDVDKFPKGPSHAHAIVSALKQNSASYSLEDYGNRLYMSMIDGEEEFDIIGTSGWNYNVNGTYSNVGCHGNMLNDYDDITWYFAAYGSEGFFPSLSLSDRKIDKEESVKVTLKDIYKRKPIADAIILINGDETSYKTDKNGQVDLFFDQDGSYKISAYHKRNGIYDMVHPESVSLQVGHSKSSGSGGGTLRIKKNLKPPITTQYTAEYTVLRKESTTEAQAMASINNLRDKIYGAMLKADTNEEALELVSDAQDASELIRWSLDKVETAEAAKETLSYTNDLMKSIAKSTEILNSADIDDKKKAEVKNSTLKATKANVDNALNTINTILATGDVTNSADLIDVFASNVLEVKKNISPEEQEELNALITVSTQTFLNEQTQITVESRDDSYVALFNNITLVELEAINKRSTELAQSLLEKTATEEIKTVVSRLTLNIDTKDLNQATAYIEKTALKSAGLSNDTSVVVKTPIGSVEVPKNLRTSVTGSQIKVSLTRIPREAQGDNLKSFIKNDSQVIDVKISMNKVNKTDFTEPIEVSIPYDAGESTQHKLVVYHERRDGTFEKLAGVYDPETQMVTFKTRHLSQFFVKPATPKFDDVTDTQWAKKSIERLNALDVIKGKDAYNFIPEEKVTRAEFATMLSRLMDVIPNSKEDGVQKKAFNDVAEGQWYSDTVNKVVAKGWMNGKSEDRFDPNGYITEQEIACVMAKVLTEHDYKLSTKTLETSDVATWAQPSVTLIKQLGMADSLSARGFKPTEKAQRDEVAVLLDELSRVLITE